MRYIKRYFFNGCVITSFVYLINYIMRPFEIKLDNSMDNILLLLTYAIIFMITGIMIDFSNFLFRKWILMEKRMEEFDKNRRSH